MKVKLHGGQRDGEEWPVDFHPWVLYIPRLLTTEESAALRATPEITWRPPEDVYDRVLYRDEKGRRFFRYEFRETAHYRPKD